MATTNQSTMPGVKSSWSFLDFLKAHSNGFCLAKDQVNKETGEVFDTLVFDSDAPVGSKIFCGFSSKLQNPPKSLDELANRKNEFDVCLLESGTYKLCKRAENPSSWLKATISNFLG